jgi:hypothetical protein
MELERISDIHYLGDKMYVMRIGDLCRDNPATFNARAQAKRFFETDWTPKRLRATVQANEFLSKTSLDLTIIMVKRQKELDEKERKQRSIMVKRQKELDEKERRNGKRRARVTSRSTTKARMRSPTHTKLRRERCLIWVEVETVVFRGPKCE